MKAELLRDMPVHPLRVKEGHPPWKTKGTIVVGPYAFRLVQMGVAIPADKECAARAGMTNEKMDAAIAAYDRIGIDREDWDAHKQGLMVGYKPDGKRNDTWQPGPNWSAGCEKAYYESQNQEEDDDE
jgi:hypothetical protein